MSSQVLSPDFRDSAASAFREAICLRLGITPFAHQRAWWAATDGLILLDIPDPSGVDVKLGDGSIVRWMVAPRPEGRARFVSDLGAFKVGKSFGSGLWAAGFGCLPGRKITLVGNEYSICEPEFNYIIEFLLSEAGMGMKKESLTNNPRNGDMYLKLANGTVYEAKSWERKDALKGKELDAYVYCVPLDAPVWMGDFSFKPLHAVEIGDCVISGKPKADTTSQHRLQRTTVTAIHRTRKEVLKITLESGRVVYGTVDHKWANGGDGDTAARNRYFLPKCGRRLAHVIDDPGPLQDRELAGWLGGMYDGEGCRTMIAQDRAHNPETYALLSQRLQQAGFSITETSNGVRWLGGRQAAVKFVNQIPSLRFRLKYADDAILTCRYKTADMIVSIESCGIQDVGCLTTDTGNFIAYGYQTSNCEAYQLPGIECFTAFSQNLRARRGFAIFPTTPDRPWVKELHNLGHGADPEFACICDVSAEANPYTFDEKAKTRDRTLMTREKFAIHYEGKLGDFVGRVFNYQRGERVFTAGSHPELFRTPGNSNRENLRIPEGWEVVGGADTGTFYSAGLIAFSPSGDAFVVEEFPNYRYVAGLPDRDEDLTIPEWARQVCERTHQLGARAAFWADANSQFKRELVNYGITLLPNKHTRETRTEVAREYFQHGRIYLAPWLQVVPFELENAAWPEEASLAGRFERVKDRDHSLDWVEHILSRRPMGPGLAPPQPQGRWADQFTEKRSRGNVHLGVN